VAALNVKLLVGGAFPAPTLAEGKVVEGQRWYRSKEYPALQRAA